MLSPHTCPTDSQEFALLSECISMKRNHLCSPSHQETPVAAALLRDSPQLQKASFGQPAEEKRRDAASTSTPGWALTLVLSGAMVFMAQAATGVEPSQPGQGLSLNADSLGAIIAPLVSALGGQFGGVVQGLTAMAMLRTVFKPIMAALEAALADHPTQGARLIQIERSTAFRAAAFVLDLLTSIKLHLVTPPPNHPGTNANAASTSRSA